MIGPHRARPIGAMVNQPQASPMRRHQRACPVGANGQSATGDALPKESVAKREGSTHGLPSGATEAERRRSRFAWTSKSALARRRQPAYSLTEMSVTEVANLPLREKLQIMEAIWADLRAHVDRIEPPQAHRDLLDARRRRVAEGETTLHDWDQVRHSIGRP